jgi:hypothetical protein
MKNEELNLVKLLEKAGWYEGRKLGYEGISEMIKNEGYAVLPNVISFLQEFMDLKVIFKNKRNGIKDDDITFSFEEATHLEVSERINGEYSQRIGKELCPIGTAYRKYVALMMSNDMCVYGGYDSDLFKIADSGIEAIKAMVNGDDPIQIS